MPRPNFFLAGAPKCGTTSLYAWLKEHPQVFLPDTKEPHFFAVLRPDRVVERYSDYVNLYSGANRPGLRAIGDASTTYLHTPGAIEAVHGFSPDAKIVLGVRNPIDMTRSLHAYKLMRQGEDVQDFEQAWRLSSERQKGRKLPNVPGVIDPFQVVYAEMGLLGKYVNRVYELFPREQVHVFVFDDMIKDPRAVYGQVLGFLGLDPDGRTDFDAKNVTSSAPRSALVYKVASMLPRPLVRALRKAGVGSTGIADKMSSSAPAKTEKPKVSPEFLSELREFYRSDVELLGRAIGRDLSGWLA